MLGVQILKGENIDRFCHIKTDSIGYLGDSIVENMKTNVYIILLFKLIQMREIMAVVVALCVLVVTTLSFGVLFICNEYDFCRKVAPE